MVHRRRSLLSGGRVPRATGRTRPVCHDEPPSVTDSTDVTLRGAVVSNRHPLAAVEAAAPEILPAVMRGTPGLTLSDSVSERLLRERIIILGSEVRDSNANEITAQLLLLAAEDQEKDITLYINSPGGSVTAGMAIYDTMMLVEPDVATTAMGLAASMGQFLLTAGAPGKR